MVEVVAWRNGNPVYIDMCPLSWDAFNNLLKLVERQCPKRKLVLQKKQMSKQLDTGIVHVCKIDLSRLPVGKFK